MLAKCKDGVRILNVARGPLVVDEDLQAALDSGKVAGAALDVFRTEPVTEHPLFGYPNVIVTPHLGASTAEATDRAGYQAAEQVVAALTGGVVTSAVNVPAISAEDIEVLGPYVPLCHSLGAIAIALAVAEGASVDRIQTDFFGRLAERDTRLLAIEVLRGALAGHTEEDVNAVNAPSIAEERGIRVVEAKHTAARDYTDLVRVEVTAGAVDGARRRHADRPAQPPAPDRGLGPALRRPARGPHHPVSLPRPARACSAGSGPLFGEHGVNIVSAAVGRQPDERPRDDGRLAAMAITTDVAGAARGRRRRSSPATGSSPGRRSRWRLPGANGAAGRRPGRAGPRRGRRRGPARCPCPPARRSRGPSRGPR